LSDTPLPSNEDEEEQVGLRPSQLQDSEMDITPMIDCTFLLLIFFLVCSHIGKSVSVDLPKAKFGVPVPSKISVILTVAKGDGEMARVYRGDDMDDKNLIAVHSPQEQEDAITQYVEENFDKKRDRPYVMLKAEKGLKHGEVSRIAKAVARASEVTELYVAVMESK